MQRIVGSTTHWGSSLVVESRPGATRHGEGFGRPAPVRIPAGAGRISAAPSGFRPAPLGRGSASLRALSVTSQRILRAWVARRPVPGRRGPRCAEAASHVLGRRLPARRHLRAHARRRHGAPACLVPAASARAGRIVPARAGPPRDLPGRARAARRQRLPSFHRARVSAFPGLRPAFPGSTARPLLIVRTREAGGALL
jgi:hypothetical protein